MNRSPRTDEKYLQTMGIVEAAGIEPARHSPRPSTLDGFPLALLATALTASLIPYPSMWQVMGLLALLVLAPAVGKR